MEFGELGESSERTGMLLNNISFAQISGVQRSLHFSKAWTRKYNSYAQVHAASRTTSSFTSSYMCCVALLSA